METDVTDNPAQHRFELKIGTELALATYRREGDRVVIRFADNGRGAVLGGNNFVFANNTLARNGVQIEDNGGSNKNISGNVLTDR